MILLSGLQPKQETIFLCAVCCKPQIPARRVARALMTSRTMQTLHDLRVRIIPTQAQFAFILPISGRKLKSAIVGIHWT